MGGRKKKEAFDKWKVLMTTIMIQSIIGGVVESYGALFVPMMNNVMKNEAGRPMKAALVGSLASGFQLGFSPVSSWFSENFGPLLVAVFGGIIVFLATFSASFARSFALMALTYGVFLGIGCSLLFITNNIIISQHFGDDSTVAYGLLGFGNGVLNSVMPHIMAYAVEELTLYGAIRTISLILSPMMFLPFYWKEVPKESIQEMIENELNLLENVPISLFEKGSNEEEPVKIKSKQTNKNNNMNQRSRKKRKDYNYYSRQMLKNEIFDYDMVVLKDINVSNEAPVVVAEDKLVSEETNTIDFQESEESIIYKPPEQKFFEKFAVFKNKGFLNLCLAMMISCLGYQVPNVHMVNYSNDLNLPGNAQILLTCLGGASAVGPLINPLFIDKFEEHISKFRLYQIFVLIYGVTVTFLPLVNNFNILMFLCILIGYSDGSFSTLVVPLIIDLVGTEKAGHCIGIFYGSVALSVTIAAPLGGFIFESYNSYTPAFYAAGLFFISGGLMLSLTHKDFKYTDAVRQSTEMETVLNSPSVSEQPKEEKKK